MSFRYDVTVHVRYDVTVHVMILFRTENNNYKY